MKSIRRQFNIEYLGHNYPKLTIEITHLKLRKKYQLIIDNPTILDNIDNIINDYLYQIQKDIREDLINNFI